MTIRSIYFAHRNPRLSRGEFPARWRAHGRLALSMEFMNSTLGYVHNDVDPDPPLAADPYTAALWTGEPDGVGNILFGEADGRATLMQHPQFPILLADEWGAFVSPVARFSILTDETVHKSELGVAAKFFLFLRPRQGVDLASFATRWRDHVQLVMRSPELSTLALKYSQSTPLIIDEGKDPATRDRILTGVAGVAEVGFASRADLERYVGHADRAAIAADLAEFADLERSLMVMTNEVTMKARAEQR